MPNPDHNSIYNHCLFLPIVSFAAVMVIAEYLAVRFDSLAAFAPRLNVIRLHLFESILFRDPVLQAVRALVVLFFINNLCGLFVELPYLKILLLPVDNIQVYAFHLRSDLIILNELLYPV